MIRFLDLISFLMLWGNALILFLMFRTFLPIRKNAAVQAAAFLICPWLFNVVVYSNDIGSTLLPLLGFIPYIALFYRGGWMEKLTALMVFYPVVLAVNYLMEDTGRRLFFRLTDAPEAYEEWSYETQLLSTSIHTCALLLRLLFWLAAWLILRKYLVQIMKELTVKMWMLVDILLLAPMVSIFTIIYFMPEEIAIVYPICGAAIFSSFGGIYLAAYISNTLKAEYDARELHMKLEYLHDKVGEEERVRSIYHDMKNHLLVLQAQDGHSQEIGESIEKLKEEIEDYEAYYHTGNDFLDIIIRDKLRKAKEKQIDFQAVIRFEAGSFMEPLDISTIFGNALDNAIEASEKVSESMRLITAKASRIHDMLVVAVENNMMLDLPKYAKTSKEDIFLHGFGLSNIRKAAEKYDGQCTTKAKDGKFVLKVMIPIPE
ncbi:MAG: GHKL domain-containing protein [Dorea sp.]|nr:GHKL domain-containing protein [Dorea sp.]